MCDPPPPHPQLKFELQNKYLSCFGTKFESSLLFSLNFLFENQLYGSAVPLIVVQGAVGPSQTRRWRAGQSNLAR